MVPVMGVSWEGGVYEGGGSAGVVERGFVGAAGRRVEGDGLVKAEKGFGFGEDIFADVEFDVMVGFLWALLFLKKLDIRSRPILLFDREEMILGEMEERGEAEHCEVCVVRRDMIVDDCNAESESEFRYEEQRKSGKLNRLLGLQLALA